MVADILLNTPLHEIYKNKLYNSSNIQSTDDREVISVFEFSMVHVLVVEIINDYEYVISLSKNECSIGQFEEMDEPCKMFEYFDATPENILYVLNKASNNNIVNKYLLLKIFI